MKDPEPVTKFAPDTPEELQKVLRRMMAKKPDDRYASAGKVLQKLAKWLEIEVPAPSEEELPRLGRAAMGSSHSGMHTPGPGSGYLSAARATLANLGGETARLRPADARRGFFAAVSAWWRKCFSRR